MDWFKKFKKSDKTTKAEKTKRNKEVAKKNLDLKRIDKQSYDEIQAGKMPKKDKVYINDKTGSIDAAKKENEHSLTMASMKNHKGDVVENRGVIHLEKQTKAKDYEDLIKTGGIPLYLDDSQGVVDDTDYVLASNEEFKDLIKNGGFVPGHMYIFIVLKSDPQTIRFLDETVVADSGHTSMLNDKEYEQVFENYGEPDKQKKLVLYAGSFDATEAKVKNGQATVARWSNQSGHFMPSKINEEVFGKHWGFVGKNGLGNNIEMEQFGAHQAFNNVLRSNDDNDYYYSSAKQQHLLGYHQNQNNYHAIDNNNYNYDRNVNENGNSAIYGYNHNSDYYNTPAINDNGSILLIGIFLTLIISAICCLCGLVSGTITGYYFSNTSPKKTSVIYQKINRNIPEKEEEEDDIC